jgi:HK97 gp10 family phage protein
MMALKSNLLAFAAGVSGTVDIGTGETAQQVKDTRDTLTPVDTGGLLNSGRVVQVATGHYQVREGDGLPDARASYTEYGTDKAPAQPHMTPAAEQHRADLSKNIARHLKELERQSKV